jgi:hypothetical protein
MDRNVPRPTKTWNQSDPPTGTLAPECARLTGPHPAVTQVFAKIQPERYLRAELAGSKRRRLTWMP